MKHAQVLALVLVAAGCASTQGPSPITPVDALQIGTSAPYELFESKLVQASAEGREVLVLVAPAIRCCAEPGRPLTPALDLWREDAELQALSRRFVVIELDEGSMYSFFERCAPPAQPSGAVDSVWPRKRPLPGAYRLSSQGTWNGCVALDEPDSREQLRALLAY